jgi:hypothetical protein
MGVLKGEDITQGRECAHAADRTEKLGFRVALTAKVFDLLVVGPDLLGEGGDDVEDRGQSR